MADLKTRRNDDGDVEAFLNGVENESRRRDARIVMEMMAQASGESPRMWGTSIIGFGEFPYRTSSGTDSRRWFKIGLSPRKQSLTLYIMDGFDRYETLLSELGSHTTGKSCLYIKDLDAVDRRVLEELITSSLEHVEHRS
jgi:hypothetical protein